MTPKVRVLGDGIGGIVTANLLLKKVRKHHLPLDLKLVGNSPIHTYQPGMLFFPFGKPGYRTLEDLQKPTAGLIAPGLEYLCESSPSIPSAAVSSRSDKP